jgi:hypothetical protein
LITDASIPGLGDFNEQANREYEINGHGLELSTRCLRGDIGSQRIDSLESKRRQLVDICRCRRFSDGANHVSDRLNHL